ncbi:phosphatidylinositol transfer protein csr1 [Dipsacomyces acuminosporus]|nr:phosphatidylinositol transfer protein csr1 [Dipsacomyces acuminosporus]
MSGLFKSISRQRSNVDVAGAGREAITTQFSKGRLDTSGSYKHLTPVEEKLLADFWKKLLVDFDKPLDSVDSDPVVPPVECDDAAETEKAKNTPPFEVYKGCMFNQTVAEKCKELGIASECGKDGELVPKYEPQILDNTLRSAFWSVIREDHPDVLVLRFLRARKWDLDKAYKMAVAAVKWRIKEKVEEIIWYGDIMNDASLVWKGVSYAHGKDKLGQPIVWSTSCLHHQKDQSFVRLRTYIIFIMETLRSVLAVSSPVERVCLIMDLTDHSNSNMDWPFVKMFLKFLESYYPECLGVCIIYNGPWWFSGVWKLISPLIDPVVASKIQFAQKPEGLLKFIDEKQLLASRGGKNKYVYEYIKPAPEENKLMFDEEGRAEASRKLDALHESFIKSTKDWIKARADSDESKLAEISAGRYELSDKVKSAALEKDRYTRARHYYTRANVLQGTTVDWSAIQSYD